MRISDDQVIEVDDKKNKNTKKREHFMYFLNIKIKMK